MTKDDHVTIPPECWRCENCAKLYCDLPSDKYHDDCETCGCQVVVVDDFGHHKCQECWDELSPEVRQRVDQSAWDECFDMGDPMCDYTPRP